MDDFFLLIFLLTPFVWIFAMIRPKSFSKFNKYSSRLWLTAFSFLLFLFSFVGFGLTMDNTQTQIEQPAASATPVPTVLSVNQEETQADTVEVTLVIDGDTIEIEGGHRVRLIGIDTPETVDPNRPDGCYGESASNYTKFELEGRRVRLEKDISETDRYGRLLRYVWLNDVLFNETLVREGYALSSTYHPDIKYQDKFTQAQIEARENKRGLWSDACIATPAPTSRPSPQATVQPQPASGTCKYSCNGPDRDCSDFSSHTEAQTFFNCCGFSASNDPMRLDNAKGQGNGLACESL